MGSPLLFIFYLIRLIVLGRGLFLFDQLVDQPRDGAASNAPGRLGFGAVGVAHVS